MNKTELVNSIAEKAGISKNDAKNALNAANKNMQFLKEGGGFVTDALQRSDIHRLPDYSADIM